MAQDDGKALDGTGHVRDDKAQDGDTVLVGTARAWDDKALCGMVLAQVVWA